MKLAYSIAAVAALALTPLTASADGAGNSGVTDQSYKAGKYSATGNHVSDWLVTNDCPRELRGMYRGNLYCRQPEYQVIAPRSAHCPEHASLLYRGNLYCVSGRG